MALERKQKTQIRLLQSTEEHLGCNPAAETHQRLPLESRKAMSKRSYLESHAACVYLVGREDTHRVPCIEPLRVSSERVCLVNSDSSKTSIVELMALIL